jgi:hypothetical protein
MNDSNGQAGPQGGRERGFLAQIGFFDKMFVL